MSYECNYSEYDYDSPSVEEILGDDIKKVENDVRDFTRDLARCYCDTDEWTDDMWDEWYAIVGEFV